MQEILDINVIIDFIKVAKVQIQIFIDINKHIYFNLDDNK